MWPKEGSSWERESEHLCTKNSWARGFNSSILALILLLNPYTALSELLWKWNLLSLLAGVPGADFLCCQVFCGFPTVKHPPYDKKIIKA